MRDLGGQLDAATTASACSGEPLGRLKYILDGGPCQVGVESTVVDGITAEMRSECSDWRCDGGTNREVLKEQVWRTK